MGNSTNLQSSAACGESSAPPEAWGLPPAEEAAPRQREAAEPQGAGGGRAPPGQGGSLHPAAGSDFELPTVKLGN